MKINLFLAIFAMIVSGLPSCVQPYGGGHGGHPQMHPGHGGLGGHLGHPSMGGHPMSHGRSYDYGGGHGYPMSAGHGGHGGRRPQPNYTPWRGYAPPGQLNMWPGGSGFSY